MSRKDGKAISEDIKDVEFSWPIGMPLVRRLPRGRIARTFIMKTEEIPQRDIDLALKRKKGGGA